MAPLPTAFVARMWWSRPGVSELLVLAAVVAAVRLLLGWPVVPFAATLAATVLVLTAIEVTVDLLAAAGDADERD